MASRYELNGYSEKSEAFAKDNPLWILNKRRLTKWEMDNLFNSEDVSNE